MLASRRRGQGRVLPQEDLDARATMTLMVMQTVPPTAWAGSQAKLSGTPRNKVFARIPDSRAKTGHLLATALAAVMLASSVFFVLVGAPGLIAGQTATGLVNHPAILPAPQALLITLGALVLLAGLIVRDGIVSWIGAVFLLAMSLLLVFSVGTWFLPIVLLLLPLLFLASRGLRWPKAAKEEPMTKEQA
jgi:hypothetical protein